MPAQIPVHVAIRSHLKESVAHSLALNVRLEEVVAVKVKQPGAFHGKVDFSQPPWHAPVANAIMDLHALSRQLESGLRSELGLPLRKRGGSNANTVKAMHAIPRLCEGADDYSVRLCAKELGRWGSRAQGALNSKEQASRLPRQPGKPEPACPWCRNHTLRSRGLEGKIWCINPGCADEQGKRPVAMLEYFRGEMVLRWQDGVIGCP